MAARIGVDTGEGLLFLFIDCIGAGVVLRRIDAGCFRLMLRCHSLVRKKNRKIEKRQKIKIFRFV